MYGFLQQEIVPCLTGLQIDSWCAAVVVLESCIFCPCFNNNQKSHSVGEEKQNPNLFLRHWTLAVSKQ